MDETSRVVRRPDLQPKAKRLGKTQYLNGAVNWPARIIQEKSCSGAAFSAPRLPLRQTVRGNGQAHCAGLYPSCPPAIATKESHPCPPVPPVASAVNCAATSY